MKLSEILEQAVIDADWQIICDLYKKITGEELEPPKPINPFLLEDVDVEILTDTIVPNIAGDGIPFLEAESEEVEEGIKKDKDTDAVDFIHRPMDNAKRRPRNTDDSSQAKPCIVSDKPPRFTENQFVDDQEEFADELVTIHPKLALTRPARAKAGKDKRDAFHKIEVKCHVCGRREMIKPAFAIGYRESDETNTYRCGDCCAR